MARIPQLRWWQSWLVAGSGLVEAARTQRHLRFELACLPVVVALGVWLRLPIAGWLWIVGCIGGVLTTELLNTAIETVVDLASPETHDLARAAKDIAAAAVLVSALTAAIIGGLVLGPPLWAVLSG